MLPPAFSTFRASDLLSQLNEEPPSEIFFPSSFQFHPWITWDFEFDQEKSMKYESKKPATYFGCCTWVVLPKTADSDITLASKPDTYSDHSSNHCGENETRNMHTVSKY